MTDGSSSSDRVLEKYKARCAHEGWLNQATAEFERAALQPLFLLNGGAVIALLTLLGAILEKAKAGAVTIRFELIEVALGIWCAGLAAAAVTTITGYLTQRDFSRWARIRREITEGELPGSASGLSKDAIWRKEIESENDVERVRKFQQGAYCFGAASVALFIIGAFVALFSIAQ